MDDCLHKIPQVLAWAGWFFFFLKEWFICIWQEGRRRWGAFKREWREESELWLQKEVKSILYFVSLRRRDQGPVFNCAKLVHKACSISLPGEHSHWTIKMKGLNWLQRLECEKYICLRGKGPWIWGTGLGMWRDTRIYHQQPTPF